MNRLGIFFILIPITILGLLLRLNNLSSFKFYPDTYQNLIVAKNLSTYGNVVGFLGTDGMLYPDFFMWTRPVYPLLINIFQNPLIISMVLGVLAIPLTYVLVSKFFKSTATGLWGSTLFALSFNHTVWSGYIMTETTGVFLMLLFLYLLLTLKKEPHKLFEKKGVMAGGIFSIAVFSRYEYAVLLIPVIIYILLTHKKSVTLLINFLTSFFLTSLIFLSLFYSPLDMMVTFFVQSKSLLKISAVFLFIFLVFTFLYIKGNLIGPKHIKIFNYFLIFLSFFSIFYSLIQPTIKHYYISNPILLSGLKDAVWQDFLLFIFFITGSFLMIKRHFSSQILLIFLSIFCLSIIYYRVNPDMFRYFTHLIPFMVIPASYGIHYVFVRLFPAFGNKTKRSYHVRPKQILVGAGVVLIFITQFVVSFHGIKGWQDGNYHQVSYEEVSSKKLNSYIKENDLLLVSLPEVYFLNTGNSTHSITDAAPYLYIGREYDNRTVTVVMDMGMEKYFPSFTKLVSQRLTDKKVGNFYIHKNFLVGNEIFKETQPVRLYRLTVGELKKRLRN